VIAKLQKELKEALTVKENAVKAKEGIEAQIAEHTQMKSKMQEIIEDKIGFKIKVEEQKERIEMLALEN
jgi:hypothetical protein